MNKPRMVVVQGKELEAMLNARASLDTPHLTLQMGCYFADADELRAWREKRASGHQSHSEQS